MQRNFLCSVSQGTVLHCTEVEADFKVETCLVPPEGLIGWWKANRSAKDSSIYHNDACYSGLYVTGYTEGSHAFGIRGGSKIAVVKDKAILQPQTVTVSAWLKGPQGGDYRWIVAKGASHCDAPSYGLYTTPTPDEIRFIVYDGSNFSVASAVVPGIWDNQNWYYVVGTYDGTTVDLYVDGVLVASTAYDGTIDYNLSPSNDLTIGGYNTTDCPTGSNNFSFAGDIDDVQLYNRALSQDEITAQYNSCLQ